MDPAALPPGPGRRAQLLLILIVLPVIVVSLPAVLVTCVFGQKPKPKAQVMDTKGLQDALQLSASKALPTPGTLTGEPVRLASRPERLGARAERVSKLAQSFGGQANEFLGSENEKHFYVEVPAGRGEAFRQSLLNGDGQAPPGLPASPAATAAAAKDQVEVFIRASQDE